MKKYSIEFTEEEWKDITERAKILEEGAKEVIAELKYRFFLK